MINSIIQGISLAIKEKFGNEYKVHMEERPQGLKEPCFFVSCLNPTHELFLGRRYFRQNQFVIQYFPKDELHSKRECNETGDRLWSCLEWITVTGDLVMGTRMRYEIVDGVLNFFVNYNMFVGKKADFVPMETLNLSQTAN